jgi:hypothetical protein
MNPIFCEHSRIRVDDRLTPSQRRAVIERLTELVSMSIHSARPTCDVRAGLEERLSLEHQLAADSWIRRPTEA